MNTTIITSTASAGYGRHRRGGRHLMQWSAGHRRGARLLDERGERRSGPAWSAGGPANGEIDDEVGGVQVPTWGQRSTSRPGSRTEMLWRSRTHSTRSSTSMLPRLPSSTGRWRGSAPGPRESARETIEARDTPARRRAETGGTRDAQWDALSARRSAAGKPPATGPALRAPAIDKVPGWAACASAASHPAETRGRSSHPAPGHPRLDHGVTTE